MNKQNGMTLIELMIVVAIIGILAGIAYPSYQDSVRKSRRAEAHTSLFAVQLALEKMRGNCAKYAAGTSSGSSLSLTDSCTNSVSVNLQADYYTYKVADNTASAYTITATAVSGKSQINDTGCTEITLSRDGTQSPAACW